MSSIAGAEVDPLFLKAINLLRSKHVESTKQLDILVQEYREKTYGVPSKRTNGDDGKGNIDHAKVNPNKPVVETVVVSKQEIKSASPITLMEKLEEITNITDEKPMESVTIKEEEVEEITVGSSLEPAHKKQRLQSKISVSGASPISDTDTHDNIPIDDIIEMDFLSDNPMCKICHLNKRSEVENLLVECSECRSHFHQQCHKPNVSTKDLNDPRLIWYCSRCTKKMSKEMAAQQQQQQQQTSTSSSGKSTNETPAKVIANPFQQAKPFRRNIPMNDPAKSVESLKIDSTKNSSVAPATMTSTDPSISSKESNTSREGSPSSKQRPREQPRDVAVNSMKRLELVKKRAKQNMQNIMKQSSRK